MQRKDELNEKLFCFLALVITFGLISIPSYAAETSSYDIAYNSNQGAFFTNGTPIVISEVDGNTTITWNGGSQIVPNTVSVFGGGNGGNYESSQITMDLLLVHFHIFALLVLLFQIILFVLMQILKFLLKSTIPLLLSLML